MRLAYFLPLTFADTFREYGSGYHSEVLQVAEDEIFKVQAGTKYNRSKCFGEYSK